MSGSSSEDEDSVGGELLVLAWRFRVCRSVMSGACWEEEDGPGWDLLVLAWRLRVFSWCEVR